MISRELLKTSTVEERLKKTHVLMSEVILGDLETAFHSARIINARHLKIEGTLDEAVGSLPQGHFFSAKDPELQLWAWAVLYKFSLQTYERYAGTLKDEVKDRYYEEFRLFGHLISIPDLVMPVTRAGLEARFQEMLRSPSLAVGTRGAEFARTLAERFRPHLIIMLMSLGLLQVFYPSIFRLYQDKMPDVFGWSRLRAFRSFLFDAFLRGTFRILKLLPGNLDYTRLGREALRR